MNKDQMLTYSTNQRKEKNVLPHPPNTHKHRHTQVVVWVDRTVNMYSPLQLVASQALFISTEQH